MTPFPPGPSDGDVSRSSPRMRNCLSVLPLLVALSACSQPQCDEAQPLIDSTAQAIAARDYKHAETDARALAAALEGADGDWRTRSTPRRSPPPLRRRERAARPR